MRKIRNRTKPTGQLLEEYYLMLSTSRPKPQVYENKRILEKFRAMIGEFPPTPELAIQFVAQYNHRKQTTRARILYILKGFYKYSGLGIIPLKIREPNRLPPYVHMKDIEKLIAALSVKKSHKRSAQRDILLIRTAFYTGMRRGELSNLKVQDIIINGDDSSVIVRGGKGDKDRTIPLFWELRNELASFIKTMTPQENVFKLTPKSISMKIQQWAVKAGVPHLHTHSFRSYLATTLFENGANPRDIQSILGHTSLETTMKYAAISEKGPRNAINTLGGTQDNSGVQALSYDSKHLPGGKQ